MILSINRVHASIYTYTTNGTQYEVTSALESAKYKLGGSNDVISSDGSTLSTVYAKGSNLSLEPLDYGDSSLVGYWPLDEGTGTTAYDYSGNNSTGTWNGTQAGSSGYYSPGKVGQWAGTFDGSTDSVLSTPSAPFGSSARTYMAWVNTNTSANEEILAYGSAVGANFGSIDMYVNVNALNFNVNGGTHNISTLSVSSNSWHFVAWSYQNNAITMYVDNQIPQTFSTTLNTAQGSFSIGARVAGTLQFSGLIDDVRIYNRALSASEIAAMYAGGK